MKRIIIHWTGGAYLPNSTDLEHYHFLIDNNGKIYKGKYKVEDNLNCQDGVYAQHTGGGNTGSIGVAMCGMWTPKNIPITQTKYPLTKKQCEVCWKLCADLVKQYNILITPDTILTHYEFGLKHPNTSSKGKIDINILQCYNLYRSEEIGNFLRNKIKWYSNYTIK